MQVRLHVSLANCAKVHRLPSRPLRACDMARRRRCIAAWCVARWPQNPSFLPRNDSFRSLWPGANAMLPISGAGAAILAPRNLKPGGAAGHLASGHFYGFPDSLYHDAFWVVFRERFFGTINGTTNAMPTSSSIRQPQSSPVPFRSAATRDWISSRSDLVPLTAGIRFGSPKVRGIDSLRAISFRRHSSRVSARICPVRSRPRSPKTSTTVRPGVSFSYRQGTRLIGI